MLLKGCSLLLLFGLLASGCLAGWLKPDSSGPVYSLVEIDPLWTNAAPNYLRVNGWIQSSLVTNSATGGMYLTSPRLAWLIWSDAMPGVLTQVLFTAREWDEGVGEALHQHFGFDFGGHDIRNALYFGDGAGLTNLSAGMDPSTASNSFVKLAGDTMNGSLTNQESFFARGRYWDPVEEGWSYNNAGIYFFDPDSDDWWSIVSYSTSLRFRSHPANHIWLDYDRETSTASFYCAISACFFLGDGAGLTNLEPGELNAATSFVRKTGDTMTGSLSVPVLTNLAFIDTLISNGVVIGRGAQAGSFYMSGEDGDGNFCTTGKAGIAIGFMANGSAYFNEDNYAVAGGIAIGESSFANNGGVGIGFSANGADGAAVGNGARGDSGAAFGASANGSSGVAIGQFANGSSGVAIGYGANGRNNAIAIGGSSKANNSSIAIGNSANGLSNGVAIGSSANAFSNGVAVGESALAYPRGVAVGKSSDATTDGTAVGYGASGYQSGAAVGIYASAGWGGAAVGNRASASGNGVAVGNTANGASLGLAVGNAANGYLYGVAVGASALAQNTNIAIGAYAVATAGVQRIAIGYCTTNTIADNTAVIRGSLYLNGGDGLHAREAPNAGAYSNSIVFDPAHTQIIFTCAGIVWTNKP